MHIQTVSSLSIFLKVRNSSKLTFIHYFEKGIIALFKKNIVKNLYFFLLPDRFYIGGKNFQIVYTLGMYGPPPLKWDFPRFFVKFMIFPEIIE